MFAGRSEAESLANLLRILLFVFALAGILVAGAGGAFAAKGRHCCPEMSAAAAMYDHVSGGAGHERGATPDCCVMGACAFMTPLAPPAAMVVAPGVCAPVALPATDDASLPSLFVSPDLRPPIA
jgi:hypothetical protein